MVLNIAQWFRLYVEWIGRTGSSAGRRFGLRACLLMLIAVGSHPAFALDTVTVNESLSQFTLGHRQLEYFVDPADRVRIDDILQGRQHPSFQPQQQDVLNLGHTDSSVWIHMRLQTTPDDLHNLTWLLLLKFPLLERVDIFTVQDNLIREQYRIGYNISMFKRPLPNRYFAQPLHFKPGDTYDVYLNIMRKGGAVQAPLSLATPTAFFVEETASNHVMGVYFGIMLAMIIYNFFLMFSVGSRTYFYYILYIFSTVMTFQALTGYGFLFLWPGHPWINEYVTQISSVVAVITGILFVRNFIKIERYGAWMQQATNAIMVFGIVLILIRVLSNNFLSLEVSAYCGGVAVVIPALALVCWRKGSRQAGIFLLAWTLLLIGTLMFTSSLLGLLPSNFLTNNGLMTGSAAEVLLLSFGLADRINRERKEKYRALQERHNVMTRLKDAEDRLIHRALHNRTTGLPNRTLLRTALDNLIASPQETQEFCLLLVSLNNFHEFNKTLGHSNGDAILRIITERLADLSRNMPGVVAIEDSSERKQYVAGVEGVTFGMLLANKSCPDLLPAINLLMTELEKPFEYQNLTLDVDVACGLAHFPDHGTTSENLLRNAHIALEAARGSKQKIAIYSPEIDPYNARRLSLLGELRQAIENNALQLYFQPQISLRDFSVAGAEVLIRWIHPEYGFIPPDEFIPLAERTGVIHPLTQWICREAFKFKRTLEQQGLDIHLSINISARNLQDPHFVEQIAQLAKDSDISLSRIIMELTETAVMTDPDDALRVMKELNGQGIRLSIDDFGTGYSSLSYLKQLPVDEIKIDRSFVMEMVKNNDDQVIVHTTLTMGHNLSLEVVAEGIEDATTLRKLKDMGCDLAQGYHIAKPMPAEDFFAWVTKYQASLAKEEPHLAAR